MSTKLIALTLPNEESILVGVDHIVRVQDTTGGTGVHTTTSGINPLVVVESRAAILALANADSHVNLTIQS